MVKCKIKFVKIWLNFKESQDASYMLMSLGLVYFNVVQFFVAFLWSPTRCPGQFFSCTIWISWTWHYVRTGAGLELNKKFKLQLNGMLQSITLDNLNHISFTIQSVFMSLSSGQLLLFHADFIHHAKNLVLSFQAFCMMQSSPTLTHLAAWHWLVLRRGTGTGLPLTMAMCGWMRGCWWCVMRWWAG